MLKNIILLGREVTYNLHRKNVKNINLRIKPDGSLHLSANSYVSQSTIDEFLRANAEQIIKALERFKSHSENMPKSIQYNDGDIIPFLGKGLLLSVSNGNKNSVTHTETNLFLTVKDISDFALKEKTIENWYKSISETVITDLCQKAYPKFSHVCKTFPQLRFRKMKSMWGNCRHKQEILTFNTNLLKYPVSAIEYVVYHEFVHFIYQNHSAEFYNELEKYIPDWKIRKKLLSLK